jgi:hypothetical protein
VYIYILLYTYYPRFIPVQCHQHLVYFGETKRVRFSPVLVSAAIANASDGLWPQSFATPPAGAVKGTAVQRTLTRRTRNKGTAMVYVSQNGVMMV